MSPSRENQSTSGNHFYVGIDAGSVSVNSIVIDAQRRIIYESPYRRHFGRVEENVAALVDDLCARFGSKRIAGIAFTGSCGESLSELLGAHYEFELISQVEGMVHIWPSVRTVISMGGQDTALMQITSNGAGWELEYFNTNGPCASGTGSFIDQQAERLATTMYERRRDPEGPLIDRILADFIALGLKSRQPANVACRCTVFTKSDMIHLQNKGERLEDIIHGLHVGNARNYVSTLVANRTLDDPILFIGGLSLSQLQVKVLRRYFPNLIVPPYSTSIGALGVALQGLALGWNYTKGIRIGCEHFESRAMARPPSGRRNYETTSRLVLKQTVFPDNNDGPRLAVAGRLRGYLGIDIGSTSTKYALIDESGEITHKRYVPTRGKPVETVQGLLAHLHSEAGSDLEILGVATTGSGRNVVGDFLKADLIIDEITAHARGAVQIDPRVDTIFEIGGQDSKYISIRDT